MTAYDLYLQALTHFRLGLISAETFDVFRVAMMAEARAEMAGDGA